MCFRVARASLCALARVVEMQGTGWVRQIRPLSRHGQAESNERFALTVAPGARSCSRVQDGLPLQGLLNRTLRALWFGYLRGSPGFPPVTRGHGTMARPAG